MISVTENYFSADFEQFLGFVKIVWNALSLMGYNIEN